MKKQSLLAAVAALALPLMVACNPGNNPDAPKTADQEFEEWIEQGSENEVTVSEKNLCGIWQLTQSFTTDSAMNYSGGTAYKDGIENHYLEIKDDHTFVDHFYSEWDGSVKWNGTWDLVGKQVSFVYDEDPYEQRSSLPREKTDYKVYRPEPEELALTYTSESGEKEVTFFIFNRLYQLPAIPAPLAESLVATPWKILSDTMYLDKYEWVTMEERHFGGTIFKPVKVGKTDMLPRNALITFASDSTIKIVAANGDVIAEEKWSSRGNLPSMDFAGWAPVLRIYIQDAEGVWSEDEEVIPGMPNNLYFWVDKSDNKKAVLYYEESLPEKEQTAEITARSWVYHLEEVK